MQLSPNVPLAGLTTLRLGGPARQLAELTDSGDLPALIAHARQEQIPPRVIGSGSNILAADDGYPGLIIRMATNGVHLASGQDGDPRVLVTVQAGHQLQDHVDEMLAEGLTGIECLTDTGDRRRDTDPERGRLRPGSRRHHRRGPRMGLAPEPRHGNDPGPNASSGTAPASSSTTAAG
jgi:hypothetical protein